MSEILVVSDTEQIVLTETQQELVETVRTEILVEEGPATLIETPAPTEILQSTETVQEVLSGDPVQELVEVGIQGPSGPPGTGTANRESRVSNHPYDLPAGSVMAVDGGTGTRPAIATGSARVLGLLVDDTVAGAAGFVQLDGVIELTPSQWAIATGVAGPLATDQVYYLSDTTPGQMAPWPPTAPGSFVSPVGRALSPTRFQISTTPRVQL